MSENRDERRAAMRREVEAMLKSNEENLAKLKAMDPADKEAIDRAAEAMLEANERNRARIEQMADEIMGGTLEMIEKKSAENPEFAAWFGKFNAEQEKLSREKDKQEGWHEVIE